MADRDYAAMSPQQLFDVVIGKGGAFQVGMSPDPYLGYGFLGTEEPELEAAIQSSASDLLAVVRQHVATAFADLGPDDMMDDYQVSANGIWPIGRDNPHYLRIV